MRKAKTPAPSIVRQPNHYRWISGIECKDVTKHFLTMPGSAIKYIWRHGYKLYSGVDCRASAIIDLEKAIECLKIEIKRIKKQCVQDEKI